MATEGVLLADLCKICHVNLPKYCCPRCSVRTCSLPCTKRHKLWAQCSGVRDPAAYKTRDELTTPSGIDQDFNFISGIERSLERADREAAAIDAFNWERKTIRHGPEKGRVNVEQAIRKCGVKVVKAPTGISRGKMNRTGWSKNQRCLSWTVEWVLEDGAKVLGTCLEKTPISEAYTRERQPLKSKSKSNKRKRKSKAGGAQLGAVTSVPKEPHTPREAEVPQEPEALQELESPRDLETLQKLETLEESKVPQQFEPPHEPENPPISLPSQEPPAILPSTKEPSAPQSPFPTEPQESPPSAPSIPSPHPQNRHLHFYLHIPHSPYPTSKTTLLPLERISTLSIILHGCTVLEFPTIYVLPYPPSDLPDRFTTTDTMKEDAGEKFLRLLGEEIDIEEEEGEIRESENAGGREFEGGEGIVMNVGERRIGEVGGEVDVMRVLDAVVGDAGGSQKGRR